MSCETEPYSLHSFQCFRIFIGLNYFNKKLDISELQDCHLSDEIQKLSQLSGTSQRRTPHVGVILALTASQEAPLSRLQLWRG